MARPYEVAGIAGSLKTEVHTKRGLPQLALESQLVPSKLVAVIAAAFAYREVRSGVDTELEFDAARLPRHAEITRLAARLELGGAPAAPSPLVQGARIEETGQPARVFSSSIDPPPGPSSLTLAVQGGEVIWTWSGRPGPAAFDIPDFAREANGFLERAAGDAAAGGDGLVTLRLTLKSDVDTRVRLSLPSGGLAYRLVQPQGWTNDLDATVHMDRNLTLGFGDLVEIPLDPIVTGSGGGTVPVEELRLEVGGEVGPERLLGEITPPATHEFATIGGGFAVAQRIGLPPGLPSASCSGVALGLALDAEVEIYLELQSDAGGSPAAGPPLASGTAVLAPPESKRAAWHTCRWTDAATVSADAGPYWLVLKEIRGMARLGLSPADVGYLGPVLLNRGGQFWQSLHRRDAARAARAHAMARLIYLPEPDTRSAALELAAEAFGADGASGQVTAKVDPTGDVQTVRLPFPAGTRARGLRLTARSHAEGTVALANLVQVYRPS
jgi:hypothetical protein